MTDRAPKELLLPQRWWSMLDSLQKIGWERGDSPDTVRYVRQDIVDKLIAEAREKK
jgi:hypothetical protein